MRNLPKFSLLILPILIGICTLVPGQAEAKSVSWSTALSQQLGYYWNWTNGTEAPIGYSGDSGWQLGLSNPNITVTYSATITDLTTNTPVTDGSTVSVGDHLQFQTTPHTSTDISWFGTGSSQDSPYGEWISGAVAPAFACNTQDFTDTDQEYIYTTQTNIGVYIPLSIAPPAGKSLSPGSNSLSCSAPTISTDGLNTLTENCTVTSGGTISPTFNIPATTGKFYYRYSADSGLEGGGSASGVNGCYGNQTALETGTPGAPVCVTEFANSGQSIGVGDIGKQYVVVCHSGNFNNSGSDYVLSVPAQTIPFSFTASSPAQPPSAPTISNPGSCTTGTAGTYTFSATSPQGTAIRYGIDWNDDGIVDQWVPASGYVNSGTSEQASYTFNTTGSHSFQVLTQDANGLTSGWTQSSINCTAPVVAPTAVLTATPSSVVAGNSSTLTYQCSTNATGASLDNGIGSVSASGGSTTVTPSGTTTYTLTCTNSAGSGTSSATVTIVPLPDLTASLVSGQQNLTVVAGQPLPLEATIANSGGGPTSGPFATTFWTNSSQSTGAGAQYVEFTSGYPNGFPANYSEIDGPQLPVTQTFNTPGTYYYMVCADRDQNWNQSVSQSNANNDCSAWGTITVTPPAEADLTAGSVTPTTATAGTPTTLSATASNIGNATSGSFPVLFQVTETGALIDSSYIGGIAQGGSAPASISYTFPSAGTYTVRACANENTSWTNIVTESNYSNNCGPWTTITVAAAIPPTINSCIPSSTTPNIGTPVTYTATPGTGASGPYTWTSSQPSMCTPSTGTTETCTYTTAGPYTMQVQGQNTTPYTCSPGVTANDPNVCAATNAPTIDACNSDGSNCQTGSVLVSEGTIELISWNATGAGSACTVSGPGISATTSCTAPSNSESTTINTQSVYSITCPGGTAKVIVNLVPSFQKF